MKEEYSLNDIGFNLGPIEPRFLDSIMEYIDEQELNGFFKRNREESERLIREFEEHTKDLAV